MEKEENTLFRRLMHFWKRDATEESAGGFLGAWRKEKGRKAGGNFTEAKAEERATFWGEEPQPWRFRQKQIFADQGEKKPFGRIFEREERIFREKEEKKISFSAEAQRARKEPWEQEKEKKKPEETATKEREATPAKKKNAKRSLWTEPFFEEGQEESRIFSERPLWREEPGKARKRRGYPIPLGEGQEKRKKTAEKIPQETEPSFPKREEGRREQPALPDMERLMRELRRRLWEEREGCGRRHRG